jgi:hypothetical protein
VNPTVTPGNTTSRPRTVAPKHARQTPQPLRMPHTIFTRRTNIASQQQQRPFRTSSQRVYPRVVYGRQKRQTRVVSVQLNVEQFSRKPNTIVKHKTLKSNKILLPITKHKLFLVKTLVQNKTKRARQLFPSPHTHIHKLANNIKTSLSYIQSIIIKTLNYCNIITTTSSKTILLQPSQTNNSNTTRSSPHTHRLNTAKAKHLHSSHSNQTPYSPPNHRQSQQQQYDRIKLQPQPIVSSTLHQLHKHQTNSESKPSSHRNTFAEQPHFAAFHAEKSIDVFHTEKNDYTSEKRKLNCNHILPIITFISQSFIVFIMTSSSIPSNFVPFTLATVAAKTSFTNVSFEKIEHSAADPINEISESERNKELVMAQKADKFDAIHGKIKTTTRKSPIVGFLCRLFKQHSLVSNLYRSKSLLSIIYHYNYFSFIYQLSPYTKLTSQQNAFVSFLDLHKAPPPTLFFDNISFLLLSKHNYQTNYINSILINFLRSNDFFKIVENCFNLDHKFKSIISIYYYNYNLIILIISFTFASFLHNIKLRNYKSKQTCLSPSLDLHQIQSTNTNLDNITLFLTPKHTYHSNQTNYILIKCPLQKCVSKIFRNFTFKTSSTPSHDFFQLYHINMHILFVYFLLSTIDITIQQSSQKNDFLHFNKSFINKHNQNTLGDTFSQIQLEFTVDPKFRDAVAPVIEELIDSKTELGNKNQPQSLVIDVIVPSSPPNKIYIDLVDIDRQTLNMLDNTKTFLPGLPRSPVTIKVKRERIAVTGVEVLGYLAQEAWQKGFQQAEQRTEYINRFSIHLKRRVSVSMLNTCQQIILILLQVSLFSTLLYQHKHSKHHIAIQVALNSNDIEINGRIIAPKNGRGSSMILFDASSTTAENLPNVHVILDFVQSPPGHADLALKFTSSAQRRLDNQQQFGKKRKVNNVIDNSKPFLVVISHNAASNRFWLGEINNLRFKNQAISLCGVNTDDRSAFDAQAAIAHLMTQAPTIDEAAPNSNDNSMSTNEQQTSSNYFISPFQSRSNRPPLPTKTILSHQPTIPNPTHKTIQLFIVTPQQTTITIFTRQDSQIHQIKSKIANKTNTPAHLFRLLCKGKPVEDNNDLNRANITNESTIYMLFRLLGGGKNKNTTQSTQENKKSKLNNNNSTDKRPNEHRKHTLPVAQSFARSSIHTTPNLTVMSFNCRSLNTSNPNKKHKKWKKINTIIRENNANIICLQETNLNSTKTIPNNNDQFIWIRCDSEQDSQRGVAIGLRKIYIKEQTIKTICNDNDTDESGRVLFIQFDDIHDNHLVVGNLYFPARNEQKRIEFLFTLPPHLINGSSIIAMDNNCVLRSDERTTIPTHTRDMQIMNDWLNNGGYLEHHHKPKQTIEPLVDAFDLLRDQNEIIPHTFEKYSYAHNKPIYAAVLDRIVTPLSVHRQIQAIDVIDIDNSISDHKPVIITFNQQPKNNNIPRRVETRHLANNPKLVEELRSICRETKLQYEQQHLHPNWGLYVSDLYGKLRKHINKFDDKQIKRRTHKISRNLTKKLRQLHRQVQIGKQTIDQIQLKRQYIKRQLKRIKKIAKDSIKSQLEQQTNRSHFQVDLDQIFQKANQQQPTVIPATKDSRGMIHVDHLNIEREHIKHWHTVMNNKPDQNNETIKKAQKDVLNSIKSYDNLKNISADLDLAQLQSAMRDMKNNSPGIDRLDLALYQTIPELLEGILLVWKERNNPNVTLPKEWKRAMIRLLHKRGDRTLPSNYRPISLLSVGFKIICKAIQLKLATVIDDIIADEQRGFIKNRYLSDNLASVLGVANMAQTEDSKLAIIALDLKSAYDSISREMIFETMRRLGFSNAFVDDITLLHTNTTAQLLINGRLSCPFNVTSGITQGNCLSVLLYIIGTTSIFELARQKGVIGFETKIKYHPPEAPIVDQTQLLGTAFVDDLIIYASSKSDVDNWISVLHTFGLAMNQHTNQTKTHIFLANRMHKTDFPHEYEQNIVQESESQRLLGLDFDYRGNIHPITFEKTINKIYADAIRWNQINLTKHEKATIVHAQLMGGLYFKASMLIIPLSICRKVDEIVLRFFIMDNKIYIPTYDQITAPRCLGGLTQDGVGRAEQNTIARLAMSGIRRLQTQQKGTGKKIDNWGWQYAEYQIWKQTGQKPSPLNPIPWSIAINHRNPRVGSIAAVGRLLPIDTTWRTPETFSIPMTFSQTNYLNPLTIANYGKHLFKFPPSTTYSKTIKFTKALETAYEQVKQTIDYYQHWGKPNSLIEIGSLVAIKQDIRYQDPCFIGVVRQIKIPTSIEQHTQYVVQYLREGTIQEGTTFSHRLEQHEIDQQIQPNTRQYQENTATISKLHLQICKIDDKKTTIFKERKHLTTNETIVTLDDWRIAQFLTTHIKQQAQLYMNTNTIKNIIEKLQESTIAQKHIKKFVNNIQTAFIMRQHIHFELNPERLQELLQDHKHIEPFIIIRRQKELIKMTNKDCRIRLHQLERQAKPIQMKYKIIHPEVLYNSALTLKEKDFIWQWFNGNIERHPTNYETTTQTIKTTIEEEEEEILIGNNMQTNQTSTITPMPTTMVSKTTTTTKKLIPMPQNLETFVCLNCGDTLPYNQRYQHLITDCEQTIEFYQNTILAIKRMLLPQHNNAEFNKQVTQSWNFYNSEKTIIEQKQWLLKRYTPITLAIATQVRAITNKTITHWIHKHKFNFEQYNTLSMQKYINKQILQRLKLEANANADNYKHTRWKHLLDIQLLSTTYEL